MYKKKKIIDKRKILRAFLMKITPKVRVSSNNTCMDLCGREKGLSKGRKKK